MACWKVRTEDAGTKFLLSFDDSCSVEAEEWVVAEGRENVAVEEKHLRLKIGGVLGLILWAVVRRKDI